MSTTYLFIDRDGTLIREPEDLQIDSVSKFALLPDVVSSLKTLTARGFTLVLVTNQDGLGTDGYRSEAFDEIQSLLLGILRSEGIEFEAVLICPHRPEENCVCRKPKTELVYEYLARSDWDRSRSFVIGDRRTDAELARNMGLRSFILGVHVNWKTLTQEIISRPRTASFVRKTKETKISLRVSLDGTGSSRIQTGIGFFDHMLEQVSRHSGIDLDLIAKGDLEVDQHHLVEDVGITLGRALSEALGQRRGINRFAYWIPMDEASAKATIDLSGRPYLKMTAEFHGPVVGGLETQMIRHFFSSLCTSAGVSLHIEAEGENTHHIAESLFKVFGKVLGQAVQVRSDSPFLVPSTKGLL